MVFLKAIVLLYNFQIKINISALWKKVNLMAKANTIIMTALIMKEIF